MPTVASDPAPVTPAPVTGAIGEVTAPAAPVSEPQRRLQVGADLANYLLLIVGGSIVVFVVYLSVLDTVTSGEVTQVYNEMFRHLRGSAVPHDASGADDTAKILQEASKSSNALSVSDAKKVRDTIEQLKKSEKVTAQAASRLNRCVQLVMNSDVRPTAVPTSRKENGATPDIATKNQQPARQDGAKDQSTQKNVTSNASTDPKNANADAAAESNVVLAERTKAFDECVQILDPLRQVSASQAIDLDRLRLLKEYAKDAHDHRQAFRSFWLQAAQLVLLNLLLPLLTALLGYIFGSQVK